MRRGLSFFLMLLRVFRNPSICDKSALIWSLFRLEILILFSSRKHSEKSISLPFLSFQIEAPSAASLKFLIDEIFVETIYELSLSSKAPFILDCGGNIGLSVLYFKYRWPQSRIIVFEPDPDNFYYLKKNIETNKLENLTLINTALSGSSGTITLHKDICSPLVTSITSRPGHTKTLQVPCECLSSFISEPVDLVKMDVEGAEWEIISELIQNQKLRFLQNMVLELHHQLRPEKSTAEFLKDLEQSGFSYQLRSLSKNLLQLKTPQEIIIYASKNSNS